MGRLCRSPDLFRFRRERLIGELRSARPLNYDECTVRRLMAGIAGLSELVERAGKLCSVANLDRFLNLAKRRHNNRIDHLADLHSLVVRNIPSGSVGVLEEAISSIGIPPRRLTRHCGASLVTARYAVTNQPKDTENVREKTDQYPTRRDVRLPRGVKESADLASAKQPHGQLLEIRKTKDQAPQRPGKSAKGARSKI